MIVDRIGPLLCILTCIFIVSCNSEDKRSTKITSEIAGSASEDFDKENLGAMEWAAAKGDRHAQALVETYYLSIGDWSRYEEWLERGAKKTILRLCSDWLPIFRRVVAGKIVRVQHLFCIKLES